MKKYKVLRVEKGELISPFQEFNYGEMKDVIGKEMVCENFNTDRSEDCTKRFYATDIEGLIYSLNKHKNNKVFEVEMGGKSVVRDIYKQGFEKQTIIRMLSENEVKKLIKEQSDKMDWDYYHACYPVNPLELDIPFNKDKALKLLKEWTSVWYSVQYSVWDSVRYSVRDSVGVSVRDSVWYSVWYSVWDSVGDSVRASVGYSVRASVGDSVWYSVQYSVYDSVWASVYAYISSLLPNIKKWRYIEHKEGVNPFQSGIDLWHMGLVPSFDGKVWRLHKGKKAEVVLEISEEELRR